MKAKSPKRQPSTNDIKNNDNDNEDLYRPRLIRCFLYILVLLPSTCLNGGRCIDGTGGYVCECPRGYKGLRCQDVKDTIREETNSTLSSLRGREIGAGFVWGKITLISPIGNTPA
ncbi:unnamed protein product [Angiostrongylus costaricensis]|uniref:EGF-like domain-containing protein n=1 Tax=Angiostrongylus costaricensis TaxID=334426 RepID=A0A0R3PPX9_ANGCS|nr:unnamed protein product [Angiostrongylus costaricensis]